MNLTRLTLYCVATLTLLGCLSPERIENVDLLIINGSVYTGNSDDALALDIAVCQQVICGVYPTGKHQVIASRVIDAKGKIVSPGFIDPHTHSMAELSSKDKNHNLNYLMQGVTTVVNGNDGDGPVDIKSSVQAITANGIGTNVALYTGHNNVRQHVMGKAARFATSAELIEMKGLVEQAMTDGALGLSTGLYYVPGSYANTEEVVTLAKVASRFNGIYDTHLRDESTFNIGFIKALNEAIDVAKQADIHLHLAHIKALGVDVWGQSEQAISVIEQAQQAGVSITADQYPWLASGTKLHSAVMPKWVMADSKKSFFQRLNDKALTEKLDDEIKENIRRRGGPSSLLITAFNDQSLVGKTLEQVAQQRQLSAVMTAKLLVQEGEVRVASFNMSSQDVETFMTKPWVVTSSDGTNGHPRKYASFAKKYQEYVVNKQLLTTAEFINRSSAQTANILGLKGRGVIAKGAFADIIVFDRKAFKANADFSRWNVLSSGIEQVLVNGELVIENTKYTNKLAGRFLSKN